MDIAGAFYYIRKVIPFIIIHECIYSTQSTRPSSITLVNISREAPRKFVIGGGRTAGRIDGLL